MSTNTPLPPPRNRPRVVNKAANDSLPEITNVHVSRTSSDGFLGKVSPRKSDNKSITFMQLMKEMPETVIGDNIKIRGTLQFRRLLKVDGEIIGEIISKGDLIIGSKGRIVGDIIGLRAVIVDGEIKGNVNVDRIYIRGRGVVLGDITCKSMILESSATINGSLNVHQYAPLKIDSEGNILGSSGAGSLVENSPEQDEELIAEATDPEIIANPEVLPENLTPNTNNSIENKIPKNGDVTVEHRLDVPAPAAAAPVVTTYGNNNNITEEIISKTITDSRRNSAISDQNEHLESPSEPLTPTEPEAATAIASLPSTTTTTSTTEKPIRSDSVSVPTTQNTKSNIAKPNRKNIIKLSSTDKDKDKDKAKDSPRSSNFTDVSITNGAS